MRLFRYVLLFVALATPQMIAAEEYWEYTFRPGDSIWKIAEQYTTSVNNYKAIQDLNGIDTGPDRQILPGSRIKIPVAMLKRQPTPAIVVAVSGKCMVIRANGDEVQARQGTRLYSGDKVITADQQILRMRFADNSELQVLANSEVTLDKLSHHKKTGMVDTRLRLNRGNVSSWVEKLKPKSRYEIKTPAAITAVRGTGFRLSSDKAGLISRTEVTEGIVAVIAGDSTKQVKEGFGIVAEKGKPLPEPAKLLPAPLIGDNQSIVATRLKISWGPLKGAGQYRYQLARDDKFNQLVTDSSTNETTITLDALDSGRYYLRVRGIDTNQLQGLDAVRGYEIAPQTDEDDSNWKKILPAEMMLVL